LLLLPPLLLLHQVKRGVLYTWHNAEGKRFRDPSTTITKRVGLNRL
jgi:cysteine synthase A